MSAAGPPQVLIEIFVSGCVPGSKRLFLQCPSWIRDDLLPVDTNNSTKPLTGGAGTDRAIEGEEERFWF